MAPTYEPLLSPEENAAIALLMLAGRWPLERAPVPAPAAAAAPAAEPGAVPLAPLRGYRSPEHEAPPEGIAEMDREVLLNKSLFAPTAVSTPRSPRPGPSGLQQASRDRDGNAGTSGRKNTPKRKGVLTRAKRKSQSGAECVSRHEEITKLTTMYCKRILDGCTEESLPNLAEEIDLFIFSMYNKGYCDMEKAEKCIKNNHEIPTPDSSMEGSLSESEANENDTSDNEPRILEDNNTSSNGLVPIGGGRARVPARLLKHMNWSSHTSCTRKLLMAVFSREVLSTHSLTGKSSPAFREKPAKKMLDPQLVSDIIDTVVDRCKVSESRVRLSITTKCADECKMARTRAQKCGKGKGRGKRSRENAAPPAGSPGRE